MYTQGWSIKSTVRSTTLLSRSSESKKNKTGAGSGKQNPVPAATEIDTSQRLELLKKVRKRIQSGFYNSDSVVEDLGFGFAQALDQTL